MSLIVLIFPFFRWGNCSRESNFLNVAKLGILKVKFEFNSRHFELNLYTIYFLLGFITSILQYKNLRFREIKWVFQKQIPCQWQDWHLVWKLIPNPLPSPLPHPQTTREKILIKGIQTIAHSIYYLKPTASPPGRVAWVYANYIISVCFSFLNCKMRII